MPPKLLGDYVCLLGEFIFHATKWTLYLNNHVLGAIQEMQKPFTECTIIEKKRPLPAATKTSVRCSCISQSPARFRAKVGNRNAPV